MNTHKQHMGYDFVKGTNHENNGSMKGIQTKDIPPTGVMLSGTEIVRDK